MRARPWQRHYGPTDDFLRPPAAQARLISFRRRDCAAPTSGASRSGWSAAELGHSGELRNETLERRIWLAITHDTHIQADIHNFRQRPAHGVMDPLWFVAKGSTTQPGQKQPFEPERRALTTAAHSVAS